MDNYNLKGIRVDGCCLYDSFLNVQNSIKVGLVVMRVWNSLVTKS